MTPLRSILLATLLSLPIVAFAQEAIETQMSPEEFKAAGLDKLSAGELTRLNAWLNSTIVTETGKAAVAAKKQIQDDTRGFFDFGSTEPVVSKVSGEFRGFARGREYTLESGQVWKQVDEASLVGVRLMAPEVRINPSLVGNSWYFAVAGYNTRAKVQRIK